MSRIGNRPIKINSDVSVTLENNIIQVKSEKGQLSFDIPNGISADISENQILIKKSHDSKNLRALHGLTARIVGNMIEDVKNGVKKILEFKGTGYRAKVEGDNVVLNMGYSHDVLINISKNLNVNIVKNKIIIEGIDRALVGQLAASIRDVRPPEVYKGKGIKYESEFIKKKAGKAAQTTAGKA